RHNVSCCASFPDACGCSKQTTFYHQLEAQHPCIQPPGMGSSRIPHLLQTFRQRSLMYDPVFKQAGIM
ncbi:hypothetical protein, partial [Ochrobactrum sp. CGA5]|uniref:hypothetical protein n=1 Tax=Ochrobactrum sp. CGA5 TaxID=2583453 RepID=UPI001AEE696D